MEKFFQLGGVIPIASQMQLLKLLENMVNCSFSNLEIYLETLKTQLFTSTVSITGLT